MAKAPYTFRQRDVTAAIKAVRASGEAVSRVEIGKDGKIVIITGREATAAQPDVNEWDEVLT